MMDVFFEETTITDVDGINGALGYRGHSIADLAREPFERVVYLLLEGKWPSETDYSAFCKALFDHRSLSDDQIALTAALAHLPVDVALQTSLSALSGDQSYPDWSLVALLPSIVVAHDSMRNRREIPLPSQESSLPADFLRRLLGRPVTKLEADVINMDFVLHADHGANASTFTARIATSAQADLCRSLTAAMATFAGPRHGGEVEGVAAMLDDLENPDDVKSFVTSQRRAGKPVMGFGHSAYRVEDPRSTLFRQAAAALSEARGDRSLLDKAGAAIVAMKSFDRSGDQSIIAPNVDLYTAVVYRLLGLHRDQFSTVFALGRTAGWLAQIREQSKGSNALIRPRLKYAGPSNRTTP